jgi:Thiamine pyrophosphate enzyme, N-terminal TPP binding domain
MARTAAQILVDQLLVHGVDTAYCVPGESYLDVLDGLGQSTVALYTTRHEAAAANMADAYGKLTGRSGSTRHSRTRPRSSSSSARSRGTTWGARPSRSSTTRGCSARWPSG